MSMGSTVAEGAADTGTVEVSVGSSDAHPTDSPVSDSSTQGGTSPSGDYTQRLREDGEFAVTEVQRWQRADSAKDRELKAYAPLQAYIEQVGGADQLVEHLQLYSRALGTAEGSAAFETLRNTGTFAPPVKAEANEDEWLDPEQKLREVRAELAQLKGAFTTENRQTHIQRMTGLFSHEMEKLSHAPDEVRQRVQKAVEASIQSSSPEQLRALNARSAKALVLTHLSDEELESAIIAKHDAARGQREEANAELATHSASGVTTAGEGEAHGDALSAYRAACREGGLDPENPRGIR